MGYAGTLEELKNRKRTETVTVADKNETLPNFTQVLWHLHSNGMPFAIWSLIKRCRNIEEAKTNANPYLKGFSKEERYILWCGIENIISSNSQLPPLSYNSSEECMTVDPATGKRFGFNPVTYCNQSTISVSTDNDQ